jgi:aldose 1-epimerase
MRPFAGGSVLDTACFPLVPFSNRIAHGRFAWGGRDISLAPNFPGSDHPHPLHGFGWLAPWEVVAVGSRHARLLHRHRGGAWPWPYRAEQELGLSETGLVHTLRVSNLGESAMPAGLGFHPYFPRNARTQYRGLHRAEWETSPDGLPVRLEVAAAAQDWWHGSPVASRSVDTVYEGREGSLDICWPDRATRLTIEPCPLLAFTVVYVPPDAGFFCVEPVSHPTDAMNRSPATMRLLGPGATLQAEVRYAARTSA